MIIADLEEKPRYRTGFVRAEFQMCCFASKTYWRTAKVFVTPPSGGGVDSFVEAFSLTFGLGVEPIVEGYLGESRFVEGHRSQKLGDFVV